MKHRHGHFDREDRHGGGPPRHPHHEHPHHHPGRGHRGGPGRFFDSNDLRFVILHLIDESPRHGYEIIKTIESWMSGAHAPSPGMIYPTLTMLEEMGLAAITVDGTRKLYSITDDGKKELKANRALTNAILQRIQQAGEQHSRDQSKPIFRAVENLKLVLRMREGQWSPQQAEAVTDIIDNAAKQIERLLPS